MKNFIKLKYGTSAVLNQASFELSLEGFRPGKWRGEKLWYSYMDPLLVSDTKNNKGFNFSYPAKSNGYYVMCMMIHSC